jgi:preprotein translocase subunit Sec63
VEGSGWGQGGEMTQALYAHMNNKTIKKRIRKKRPIIIYVGWLALLSLAQLNISWKDVKKYLIRILLKFLLESY